MTHLLDAGDLASLARAAALLLDGHLVAFPTDTVYGVGATAFSDEAIARLYVVKQRTRAKGIPVLIADFEDLSRVSGGLTPTAERLIAAFWPGQLTLILPRLPGLPAILAPDETVAVRLPDHLVTRQLIRQAGGAVATTSANLSGRPPANSGQEALAALDGLVAAVVDDGPSPRDVSSTIVDCTAARPAVLRAGPISADEIEHVLGSPDQGR